MAQKGYIMKQGQRRLLLHPFVIVCVSVCECLVAIRHCFCYHIQCYL